MLTGYGVAEAVKHYYEIYGGTIEGKKAVVQGFGNVGYHLSKFLTEEDGVKLIGIAEYNGAIFNEDGINVEHAKKYFTKNKTFEK